MLEYIKNRTQPVWNSLSHSCVQSCPTLCNPMDYSPPGSLVHGISQARILKWVAISLSRGSSQPRLESTFPALAGRFFITTTREASFHSISLKSKEDGFSPDLHSRACSIFDSRLSDANHLVYYYNTILSPGTN